MLEWFYTIHIPQPYGMAFSFYKISIISNYLNRSYMIISRLELTIHIYTPFNT